MAISPDTTGQLCRWVCSTRYEDLPAEVHKETVTLLYDQVGCMIACATLPSCQPVVDLVRKLGGPEECSIVGHPVRTSVTNAALANGTIGHGDEVDSTGQQGTGHYAASAVPTVLSVGQYTGASGKDLVRALALGSEVAARLQSLLYRYSTRNQFYATVSGALGAAVNAGLLLGLDPEQTEHALGLAASGACGLTSHHLEELHQTKSLDRGRAANAGVLSALLAQEGFHGPREVLTIENGFFDAFLGLPSVGHQVLEGLGEHYLMRQVAYKRYPVGAPNQTPLYALLQLMKGHNLNANDIDQIEVSVSRDAFHVVKTNKHPSVHMETILSLAAVYGEISFEHIHDPSYREDPRVKTFQERARIMIIPRPGPASRGERLDAEVMVRTHSGEVLHQNLRYPLMTEEEIQEKFRYLVSLRLSSDRMLNLEQNLLAIEGANNVAPLISEMEVAYYKALN
ncbi:MAG TPA: MmgE/PrpD family protein [Dehalococcoidia bacterium]|nr:MmgE/PrpD family protein [Dehalococcoidia bacterium]